MVALNGLYRPPVGWNIRVARLIALALQMSLPLGGDAVTVGLQASLFSF